MSLISLYDKRETNFSGEGLVLEDCTSCFIEEELNGSYQLELTHPITNSDDWKGITEESIIKADGQLFRVFTIEKNLSYMTVYARHIFYDLLYNFIEDLDYGYATPDMGLRAILSSTAYSHRFTGESNLDSGEGNIRYKRVNPIDAILGGYGLVARFGGELERDNFHIRLKSSIGVDKGYAIIYGSNVLGLDVDINIENVITRVYPVGRDGLTLPEGYVDAPSIDTYSYPRITSIDTDIRVEDFPNRAAALEELRFEGRRHMLRDNLYIAMPNIRVDLLQLENTEEFKDVQDLILIELGDTVSCTENPLGVSFKRKVIKIRKDVLTSKNVAVEIGYPKKLFTGMPAKDYDEKIKVVDDKVVEVEDKVEEVEDKVVEVEERVEIIEDKVVEVEDRVEIIEDNTPQIFISKFDPVDEGKDGDVWFKIGSGIDGI